MQLEFLEIKKPPVQPAMRLQNANGLGANDEFGLPSNASPEKLLSAIEAYIARVDGWEDVTRAQQLRQRIPSITTLGLLLLGGVLAVVVNVGILGRQGPFQQLFLANLGCMMVLILAGTSLFYDRAIRGYGRALLLRESSNRATEISQQLRTLVLLREDLQGEVDDRRRTLSDLQSLIATSQSQSEDYEAKLSNLRLQLMDETSRLSRCQHSVSNLQAEQHELELSVQAHTDRLFEVSERHENLTAEVAELERERLERKRARDEEHAEYEARLESLRSELDELNDAQDRATNELEALHSQVVAVRNDRSDLQCEMDLIREEFERNTAANIQSLTKMRTELQDLQIDRHDLQQQVAAVKAEVQGLKSVKESLESRIEECRNAKAELESELNLLHEQICDGQNTVAALESSIESVQLTLEERRLQAEKEANEAEMLQKERNRILLELDRSITNAIHEREAIDAEILRLSGVRSAMELTIDELTNRLESRTTELRRRSNQIQEHAERLEKLSEAIQRLTSRESEIRRTSAQAIERDMESLPSGDGMLRGLHGPHLPSNLSVRLTEDIFEG